VTRHRVLVVEQDQAIRRLLLTLLGDSGHDAQAAASAAEALAAVRSRPPDLIVIDPFMLGAEPDRLLAALGQQADVPVVILSAVPRLRPLSRHPKRAWLDKPFDIDRVVRLVERLGRRFRRPARRQLGAAPA